nr:hypothetical protein [Tanacetum cinerariifolium]
MDKEEQMKKAKEEARLFAITKPKVIKVVWEEAKKLGIHQNEATTTKAGEKFKKAHDAEHEVLKRQYTEKIKKSIKIRKHKFDNYMWTISSRLKPGTIIDIKFHPKTKPFVITVFKGVAGKNFDVYKPYFCEFELRSKLALPAPAPAPEQASSKSSRKKKKHMELEPEIKILRLEYNRALPKNVMFIKNMVIKSLSMRSSSLMNLVTKHFKDGVTSKKVRMEALVSYLVAASMVQSPKSARFNIKLKKLNAEHPDQEKLKLKKVKLEALGYEMN